jgi:hypothetical protein
MRTILFAILLAFLVRCARADVIDDVVNNLPDGWNDNETGLILMPKTASNEDVLHSIFQNVYAFEFGEITNFTILETRQVRIPCCHFPNAPAYSYTAVIVQPSPSQGGKIVVVLLRYFDVDTSRAWSSAFFEANIEDTWKKIENDSFSFSLPSSFKKKTTHGIDSFVEEYVSDGIDLSFDCGPYSNDFSDWPKETTFENLKIDGQDARIGTVAHEFHEGFSYSTQVHFAGLTMYAACKSDKEAALARKIFKTIVFKAENF